MADKKHVITLQGRDFVTYEGLLATAHEQGLEGIKTTLVQVPDEHNGRTAIVLATVRMAEGREFDGIGDASPNNVSRNITPHIIRMAETRAKARALRDATNIGMTAFEELGDMGDEGHSAGKAEPQKTQAKPRPAAQAAKPPATAPAPQDLATKAQIDESSKEMKRAGLTAEQGRAWLFGKFGKSSRLELSQAEITQFLDHLKALPAAGQAPAEEEDEMVRAVREAERAEKAEA